MGEFGGEFNFQMAINTENPKSFAYSSQLSKVFIGLRKPLDVRFSFSPARNDLAIRATLIFEEEWTQRVSNVRRCSNHLTMELKEKPGNRPIADHVLRTEHPTSAYETDRRGVMSVVTPLTLDPMTDFKWNTVVFSFHCMNSCPGGIDRRRTMLIFTLEDHYGTVFGMRSLLVHVCSSPRRDKDREEKVVSGGVKRIHDGAVLQKPAKKPKRLKPNSPQLVLQEVVEPAAAAVESKDPDEVVSVSMNVLGSDNYVAILKYARDLMTLQGYKSGQMDKFKVHVDQIECTLRNHVIANNDVNSVVN